MTRGSQFGISGRSLSDQCFDAADRRKVRAVVGKLDLDLLTIFSCSCPASNPGSPIRAWKRRFGGGSLGGERRTNPHGGKLKSRVLTEASLHRIVDALCWLHPAEPVERGSGSCPLSTGLLRDRPT
jgi:hypothetical protein